MSIKQAVGGERYEEMRRALRTQFPDPQTIVTDLVVDFAFQVAKHIWKSAELDQSDIPEIVQPTAAAAPGGEGVSYYIAHAMHARTAAPGSVFTGHLPVVRFRLPSHGTNQTLDTLHTPAGDILPVDRLNASIDVLWETYKNDGALRAHNTTRPERVDLITPPRLHGARFSAVSVYLCYAKATDPSPTFYILEAGLATGQARMPFLGPTMSAEIIEFTQYEPTAFAKRSHIYRGTFDMRPDAPSEPLRLVVDVFRKGPPPTDQYISVRVGYEKVQTPSLTYPFLLTVEAGARVQAIADALGVPARMDTAQRLLLRLIDAVSLNALFDQVPQRA
jgi:hypothetical protein